MTRIHAAHLNDYFFKPPAILLDGKPVKDVVEVDDVEGFIVCAVRDENGKILFDRTPWGTRALKTERFTGVVELIGERRQHPADRAEMKRARRRARNLRIAGGAA